MPTKAEVEERIDRNLAKAEAKYLGRLVRRRSMTLRLVGVVTEIGVYGRDVDRDVRPTNADYSRIIVRINGGTWRWLNRAIDMSCDWEVYDG